MKLIITIDLPDQAVNLASTIEDRVRVCVERFSEKVHVKFGIRCERLMSDQLFKKLRRRIYGRSPSGAGGWVRFLERAATDDDE
jgi:hypothetical protein